MFNSDPHWLKNVITEDETWVYGYDLETKSQTSQCLEPGEPRFKKARMIKSKLKCLLITFFDVAPMSVSLGTALQDHPHAPEVTLHRLLLAADLVVTKLTSPPDCDVLSAHKPP
ncbi:hypothetical protein LAZ67_15000366 [Cordylochernes scorpioides]|uniref:Mariner Mos1 transposase n=1 Tax=Cordylochernes scorpioides TaxID=51811 RepID=A0ABY6L812_9ARAC|nr:hypothetical protein LAZ67_15000366 [Cordylochernes scorpioides]